MDIIYNTTGWLGASKPYLASIDTSKYPGLDFYVRAANEATDTWGPIVDPIEGFTNTEWNDDVQEVTFGKTTPEDMAKKMQAALTSQLKDRGI
jgi:ABC-type glycerol-3-phosphate transport system substrate-binding protein